MCAACVEKRVKGGRRTANKGQFFLKVFVETKHGRMRQFTFNPVKGSNDRQIKEISSDCFLKRQSHQMALEDWGGKSLAVS